MVTANDGKRVLLVDDEPLIRRSLARTIGRRHDITAVESATKAMELLSADTNFDVILCDVMMPGVTGIDFHSWIVEWAPELERRLVFMTGGAFTPDSLEFMATTSARKLDKPIETKKLYAAISELSR